MADASLTDIGITGAPGHVIQTVANSYTSASAARTTNSYAKVLTSGGAANWTGQITNVLASSSVLIQMHIVTYTAANDAADGGAVCLYRESTIIYEHAGGHSTYIGSASTAQSWYDDWQINFLDSSPGTGTNNYFLGYRIYANASISIEGNNPFHIIMQEIAA